MKDLQVVTVSSHRPQADYFCYSEFFDSLKRVDVEPLLIKPWKFGGLGSKPRELYKAIRDGRVNAKNIIFVDCWDLVFAARPKEILAHWAYYPGPFMISAERNCFPSDLKAEYDALPHEGSSYRYLNSGFIIAETEAMLAVLESMDAPNIPDDYQKEDGSMEHINDQFLFQKEFLKQPVPMLMDYKQQFSQTMNMVGPDDLDMKGVIKNKETGSYPLTFHFNGGSKTAGMREPILKHLGL